MSYVPRKYDEIVRDLLTTLTGGTVRETVPVPPGELPIDLPKLRDRPVRRVSHLEGVIEVGKGANARQVPYRFTQADFELVASSGKENEKDSLRFRKDGKKPVPGSQLTVNYYPLRVNPTPLTDLNVGSVTRTLMETVAREMALVYLGLEYIYKSAYVDTAEGPALDNVVALIGLSRLPAGHPVVKVRFTRRAAEPGRINVPAGTPVIDAAGSRYLTLDSLTLEPYETTREVLAGGETAGTTLAGQGQIDRLETLIAGISEVTNPEPTRRLAAPETDDELRRRAKSGLQVAGRGTRDSLRFGLLSIPGVKDVAIEEAPNGVPGEVQVQVAYSDNSQAVKDLVAQRIDELRPAGIRVIQGEAQSRRVSARVELTLAGTGLPAADLPALTAAIEEKLAAYLRDTPPGGQVRRSRLTTLALEDPRVVDARVVLTPQGEAEVEEFRLDSGQVLEVVRPFIFPTPISEQPPGAVPATLGSVHAMLPIHLAAGVTQADATQAITLALDSFLSSRRPDAPLTVDGLAAAIRDDSRFALVRAEVIVTVESGGRFLQLTDGVGSYAPAANETLQKGTIDIVLKEGGA